MAWKLQSPVAGTQMRMKSMSARARLKMRMLVVFRIFLFVATVNITNRLPTKPTMMMTMKKVGTTIWAHVSSRSIALVAF